MGKRRVVYAAPLLSESPKSYRAWVAGKPVSAAAVYRLLMKGRIDPGWRWWVRVRCYHADHRSREGLQ